MHRTLLALSDITESFPQIRFKPDAGSPTAYVYVPSYKRGRQNHYYTHLLLSTQDGEGLHTYPGLKFRLNFFFS